MKRVLLLLIIIATVSINAIEYRLVHLKKGARLNVREAPIINSTTAVGTIPADAEGITIRECKVGGDDKEWCYISYPIGADHLEGWVSRYFLAPMGDDTTSFSYIKTFLKNYYLADEDNFFDKLSKFYHFPMQQYFKKKNLRQLDLRNLKVAFYKKWYIRRYTLLGVKVLKRTVNYVDVRTVVKWRFKSMNGTRKSGRYVQKVRLVQENGKFKVLAIKNLKNIADPKGQKRDIYHSPINTNGKQFYIKIGSFSSKPNDSYLLTISQKGFRYMIDDVNQNGKRIKRLYIGPYPSESRAKEILKDVRAKINKNAYIQSF